MLRPCGLACKRANRRSTAMIVGPPAGLASRCFRQLAVVAEHALITPHMPPAAPRIFARGQDTLLELRLQKAAEDCRTGRPFERNAYCHGAGDLWHSCAWSRKEDGAPETEPPAAG